jgi:Fic family protein
MLKERPERWGKLLGLGFKPEVEGRYLHWDEVRRRSAPQGVSVEEWWLAIRVARTVVRTFLPLMDKTGQPFSFSRTDGLLLSLHQIDRDMGGPLEMRDPLLANKEVRDSYLIRSLMEEAITSSQLEGASTTRQVAKQMLLEGRTPRTTDERMIANNFVAMSMLRARAQEPLSRDFVLELHEVLTHGTLKEGEVGRFRRRDKTINVQDNSTGDVLHMPPDAKELPKRLDALCAFANEQSSDAFIHPVVRAVVLHFMLAYDHPFVDGNGRTARALFYWSMIRQKYWRAEFLSISRIIQKAPAQYGRAFLLTETDSADVTYYLLHQLEVIQRATKDLHQYLAIKQAEVHEVEALVRTGENLNHRQRSLLAHALRHSDARYSILPYQREHGIVYETARRDLLELADAGYLNKTQMGRAFLFRVDPTLGERLKKKGSRKSKRGTTRRKS